MKAVRLWVRALEANSNAPAASMSSNPAPTSADDPLKTFTDMINQVKAMDASRREEASALLKDLVLTFDF